MELQLPTLHDTQRQVWDARSRYRVLACGRRWGKTLLGSLMCIVHGTRARRAWWVAPTYKLARVGWRSISHLALQIPGAIQRKGDLIWELPGGGSVQVRSADDPQSLRSEGLDFVVFDECAYMAEEAWLEAVRPALSDRLGGAVFISTPKGRNWFWRLWQRGRQGSDSWQSWQFPTSANPYILKSEIEEARGDLPEAIYRQEYLAEFLEHEGAVFRNIQACTKAPEATVEDHKQHRKVLGVDWGKHNDFTVLSVVCADCGQELALDRFNQIDYTVQRQRLWALSEKWQPAQILAEANAMGEPIIDQLQSEGFPVIGFTTTASSKPQLIENLALAFEREECQWLPASVGIAELEAYERKVSATTGRSSYSAPSGLHDDTVIARALAWRAACGTIDFDSVPQDPGRPSPWDIGATREREPFAGGKWVI